MRRPVMMKKLILLMMLIIIIILIMMMVSFASRASSYYSIISVNDPNSTTCSSTSIIVDVVVVSNNINIVVVMNIGGETLLLPLSGLVVLEPVKDVFALDLAVLAETGRDPLDLLGAGRADAIVVVKLFEDPYLLRRWGPPTAALPAAQKPTSIPTVTIVVSCFVGVGVLMSGRSVDIVICCLVVLLFHDIILEREERDKEGIGNITKG